MRIFADLLKTPSDRRAIDQNIKQSYTTMEDDWYRREQLHFAAQVGDLSRVEELIVAGYDVNAFDEGMRYTPLHYAVKGEFFAVTRYLISRGADVNAHDEARIGETPLGAASPECSFEMAELLIQAGADPSITGWMGITAVHRAKDRKDDDGQRVFDLLSNAARRDA